MNFTNNSKKQITHQFDVIQEKMEKYYSIESDFKEKFKTLLNDELYKDAVSFDDKVKILAYVNVDAVYFSDKHYNDEAINTKNRITHMYLSVLQKAYFLKHKAIVDYQATII